MAKRISKQQELQNLQQHLLTTLHNLCPSARGNAAAAARRMAHHTPIGRVQRLDDLSGAQFAAEPGGQGKSAGHPRPCQ
ncbi:hypothetical protein [Serratia marcescens]|uniref:hypothetical protein n=1 Tax=Serratia marcescens TaxID=615 RepID=UPI001F16B50A|nr:hypothetical protein [Serratia marcescens]